MNEADGPTFQLKAALMPVGNDTAVFPLESMPIVKNFLAHYSQDGNYVMVAPFTPNLPGAETIGTVGKRLFAVHRDDLKKLIQQLQVVLNDVSDLLEEQLKIIQSSG